MDARRRRSCDIAVIGAGPAGLAAADIFQKAGYDCLVFDAGGVAHNLSRYPTFMQFFSTRHMLELGGFPLTIPTPRPTRREYLYYLWRFCLDRNLKLRLYETVESVAEHTDGFTVRSRTVSDGEEHATRARHIVIATGGFATPNMLGCPGEVLPKVTHYYTEPAPYFGQKVLVVGGGNSAVEAALELRRADIEVTIAVREEKFTVVKYWLLPDIEGRIRDGVIPTYFETRVREIRPCSVVLSPKKGGPIEIPNDFVLALTGYQPNTCFLRECGVEVDEGTRKPRYNPDTLETNVPGLFVAGDVAAGAVSGEIFIENSRNHGKKILAAIT